jgi:DNA-binding transcriptional LysR family regulator
MQFHGLDLNLLVVLDAVLTERSVTRAAERIHLSQSASSGALARLRDFFKDELLVQVGHKMVLTARAESLVDPVRNILLQTEEIINTRPAFVPGSSNRNFRLMMSDYVATVLMPQVLSRLHTLAPGVTVEVLSNADSSIQALERDEVDFLIAPPQHISELHPREDLFSDGYVCVICSENSQVGSSLSLDEYLALGHVVARFGKSRTPSVDEWFFERFGPKRRIEVVAMSFNLLPQFVIGTTRIATMPESIARRYGRILPLRIIPTPTPIPRLNEVLQWHRCRDADSATIWFRELLRTATQELSK